jgi:hypothetical protein
VAIRDRILSRLPQVPGQGTEEAALRLLALRKRGGDPNALIGMQHPSGGWPGFPGIGPPSAFHTGLALVALRPFQTSSAQPVVERAFGWLSPLHGLESHWLWRWKFRFFDKQVQFDPMKSGWPWVEGTVSWVAPTALSILAFRSWDRESDRVPKAVDMLLDRACPRGGWNAGNAVAFGVELSPHPDFTAMALLALRGIAHAGQPLVRASLDYLAKRLEDSQSTYSLAWAVMALSAYGHDGAHRLRQQLEKAVITQADIGSTRVLALAALALEGPPYTFQEVMP